MSVFFRFTTLDKAFDEALNEKFIVNHVDGSDPEVKEEIDSLLFKHYDGVNLSHVPSCTCGDMKGTLYLGMTCPKCSTKVVKEFDEDLAYLVWLERPDKVQKLIAPHMLDLLLKRWTISKPSVALVEYIIDTNYRINGPKKFNRGELDALDLLMRNKGLARGYNNFVKNFREFVILLEENFGKGRKKEKQDFIDWVFKNEEQAFSNYVPIVNRSLFVFENVGGAKFYDRDIIPAVDAVRRFTGIDLLDYNTQQKQNRTAKGLINLANFYPTYANNSFYGKKAIWRRLISRVKSHHTMRAVISSLPAGYLHDEIMLPRTPALALLRPFVLKALKNRGYSIMGAVNHISLHEQIFDQTIYDILQEIVDSTKRGIPMTIQRPPTMHRGSILNTRAGIKSDPEDFTIGINLGVCASLNADFDGDMAIAYLQLVQRIIKYMQYFNIHHSSLSMRGPNRLSGITSLTKTEVATLANWIED